MSHVKSLRDSLSILGIDGQAWLGLGCNRKRGE
jgi:hypothetical protein